MSADLADQVPRVARDADHLESWPLRVSERRRCPAPRRELRGRRRV